MHRWFRSWRSAPGAVDAPRRGPGPPPSPCEQKGSIIQCENQGLGWEFPITGTSFSLRYQSDRQAGFLRPIVVPITDQNGFQAQDGPKRIEVEISVAGVRSVLIRLGASCVNGRCNYAKSDRLTWNWNGNDVYGRRVQGPVNAYVTVSYVYDGVVREPTTFGVADISNAAIIAGTRSGREYYWNRWYAVPVGNFDSLPLGFGGLSITSHHSYDPATSTVYFGDGRRRNAQSLTGTLTTVIGGGTGSALDNDPAKGAYLGWFTAMAAGPDGAVYVGVDGAVQRAVRRVSANGLLTTAYGLPSLCAYNANFNDGDAATGVCHPPVNGIGTAADDSFYVTTAGVHQVIRVSPGPNRTLKLIAGKRDGTTDTTIHDGAVAANTAVNIPYAAVAYGRDGSVFFTSGYHHIVYQVTPDGILHNVGGLGSTACTSLAGLVDGAAASGVPLCNPRALAVGKDGSVYVGLAADNADSRVVKLGVDGRVKIIAGGGATLSGAGDGNPATQVQIGGVYGVALDSAGTLFFSERSSPNGYCGRLWKVTSDGTLRRVAGKGSCPTAAAADGTLAVTADSRDYYNVAAGADGYVYWVENTNTSGTIGNSVRRVATQVASTTLVPSDDGSEVYEFDAFGRHLKTRTGLRGIERLTFGYDGNGLLTSIVDRSGTIPTTTSISRTPTTVAITAPFGTGSKTTTIARNASAPQYATAVSNPANETFNLTLGSAGLMTQLVDPQGGASHTHAFVYDGSGRLTSDRNTMPSTLGVALSQVIGAQSRTVTTTSPEGRARTYSIDSAPSATVPYLLEKRTQTTPLVSNPNAYEYRSDGTRKVTDFSGTTVLTTLSSDAQRFGMLAPYTSQIVTARAAIGYLAATTLTQNKTHCAHLSNASDVFSLSNDASCGNGAVRDEVWSNSEAHAVLAFDAAA